LSLERNFTPKYLGYNHMSRAEFVTKHSTIFSQILTQPEDLRGNLIVILDGTYLYIQK